MNNTLTQHRVNSGIYKKMNCSHEEDKTYYELAKNGNPLPKGVYAHSPSDPVDGHYHMETCEENEVAELLVHRQIARLNTIKHYLLFFVVLTCIGIGLAIIFWMWTAAGF